MSRPEHAALSITDDLNRAAHNVLCAAEFLAGREARELILTYKRIIAIRNQFVQGGIDHATAKAFAEAGEALAMLAEGRR